MRTRPLFFVMIFMGMSLPALAQERIVVGQSAPLTGENSTLGKDIRDGAFAYFKFINDAGGVNGRIVHALGKTRQNC
jgi:branched-chain amino acid transport system substrate-binding protein